MPLRLNPYLSFTDNARAAMEFYQSVFGGDLVVSTFGDMGDKDAPGTDLVMHAMLETPNGLALMGADTPPGMDHNPGNTITVSLSGDDGEALRGYWEKLSDGGDVQMPLEKQVWGDEFGACTDKFGVPWLVNISQPTA